MATKSQDELMVEGASLGKELKDVQESRRTCKASWMIISNDLHNYGAQIRALMDKQVDVNRGLGIIKGRV